MTKIKDKIVNILKKHLGKTYTYPQINEIADQILGLSQKEVKSKEEILKEFEKGINDFRRLGFGVSREVGDWCKDFLSQALDQYGKREIDEYVRGEGEACKQESRQIARQDERKRVIGIIKENKIIQGKRGSERYTRKYVLDIYNHALDDILQALDGENLKKGK